MNHVIKFFHFCHFFHKHIPNVKLTAIRGSRDCLQSADRTEGRVSAGNETGNGNEMKKYAANTVLCRIDLMQ